MSNSGQQPKKGIMVQIPLCRGMKPDDDIVIVRADENTVSDEDNADAIVLLPEPPKVVDCNLVFEVSHFSM